jgi:cathepsin B
MCPAQEDPTPACRSSCSTTGYPTPFDKDRKFAKTAYNVPSDVPSIQAEIMAHGPITAAFTVYQDFITYKSGVYQHLTGQALGGHAVKIIGWGVDGTTPYWTVMNSWNEYWGDWGSFKILRGSDECGIEDQLCAGLV